MTKQCYVCGGLGFKQVLNSFPAMTSDVQTIGLSIEKEECDNCGTVRSSDTSFLEDFYKNYYRLNISNLDPVYIFEGEESTKSKMHLEWINRLAGNELKGKSSIIEIGCGSGNLLERFDVPNKFGVEPSKESAKHAVKKANVRAIGYEDIQDDECYDVVLSTCVIEHTLDPNHFMQKCFNIVSDDGVVIIGLPIQDLESFDVYFLDHLHHLTKNQFITIANNNGFEVANFELGYKCMTTIGYFVLKKNANISSPKVSFEKNVNFSKTEKILATLNLFLKENRSSNLLAFGYGETSFFFQTYSSIDSYAALYIDDVRANENDKVVSVLDAINSAQLEDAIIILLINPYYNKFIIDKFSEVKNVKFYSPFTGNCI